VRLLSLLLFPSCPLSCLFPVLQGNKSFFSEIIASISDIRFSRDGRYILSRDYMNLKLWDMAMENKPVVTLAVHEELRPRVRRGRGLGMQQQGPGGCVRSC
jgi:serine/threonine-protein phosphatase 2A regulatory subunit B